MRNSEKQEPVWLALLHSPLLVAIVTVAFGSLLANWIAGVYQERQQERELQYAVNELRTRLLDEALTLMGKVRGAAESRIEVDSPQYARRISIEAERVNAEQKLNIRRSFNAAWQEWDSKKLSMLARIRLNFGVAAANEWAALIVGIDDLLECASTHVPNPGARNLCKAQLDQAGSRGDAFLASIQRLEAATR